MKRSLKLALTVPALTGIVAAGFLPAQAESANVHSYDGGKEIACTREYSPTYERLSNLMGADAYRINELMTQAVNNNTRIALDYKFQQAFADYGTEAGNLAYQYYSQSCWTI